MASFQDLFDSLDPDQNARGRQFERICKWFLTHDPRYRGQLREVWLWDQWPGRWGPDTGIDLVAKHQDGSLWAIQAKAYSPDYNIKKADVDSFLSESGRPQFSYRLLIATTNRIGKKARRTLEDQEKLAGLIMRGDLDKADLVWPTNPSDLRAPKPKPKTPRPHSREAVRAVTKGLRDTARGQLVMACGTGKTLVGLWVAEAFASRRTLVLLPSLSLLSQTLREWTANAKESFAFLPVCSDETVRGQDHLVSHTAELGMPVTTDPTVIATFLRKRAHPRVVFSTYQSSPQIAAAFDEGRVPPFDLVIADEAHRVAGPVSSDFATVLDGDAIRARRRLFMTATPRYFSGRIRQEARQQEFEIASMDDEERFGPVLHQLSFGEAIDKELLTDYQVVIVGLDDPTYRRYVEKGVFVTRDGKAMTDARTLAAHVSVAKAMREFDLRRTISFHSRVAGAKAFASEFSQVVAWMPTDDGPDGELICDHVSGEMSSGQRDVRLDRLRHLDENERGLLSNARCLGEGVDVPTLDGVAFIDPKGSQIDIIQAVGRVIRRAKDKTIGTIVLPVFISPTEDSEAVIESSDFRPIWSVLKALRSHDEQLAEQLDNLMRQLGERTGGVKLPSKIHIDLPISVTDEFVRAFKVRLVESTTSSWEFFYGMLRRFAEENGHCSVPRNYESKEGSYRLGAWASTQRMAHRRSELSEDRVNRLGDLGFVWNLQDAAWEEGFVGFQLFLEEEGHPNVPRGYRTEGGFTLGGWCLEQRQIVKRDKLSAERAKRLTTAGFDWNPHSTSWEEGFGFLKRFASREGHTNVSQTHLEDDYRLGIWVSTQRRLRNRGDLSSERRERLTSLGLSWDMREEAWEEGFAHLERFVNRKGHANVPARYIDPADNYRLGSWVNNQRQAHRRASLSAERSRQLETLGFHWSVRSS